jgi:transposase
MPSFSKLERSDARCEAPACPETFEGEAVDRVTSSGLAAGAVARELGLHETVLRPWMSQFSPVQATGRTERPSTQAVAPSPSDLVADNARLRSENKRPRKERDILKKAALIIGAASR